jgi:hypothetical protein
VAYPLLLSTYHLVPEKTTFRQVTYLHGHGTFVPFVGYSCVCMYVMELHL